MNFDTAFADLLAHEGGYSNHPNDPGGATRYGVTEAVAREAGYTGAMQDLPLLLAQKIYRRQYWDSIWCDDLPAIVRYAVFDAAVNSGTRQSVAWLQRALQIKEDGVMGPQTLAAAREADPQLLLRKLAAQRLRGMTVMQGWTTFSRGWTRRIAAILEG